MYEWPGKGNIRRKRGVFLHREIPKGVIIPCDIGGRDRSILSRLGHSARPETEPRV